MDYFSFWILAIPVMMVISIRLFWELGRLIGRWRIKVSGEDEIQGSGNLESATFALLGLLIGFTFFGAADRFDNRRKLIVDEANIIGTTYLRIDFLPEERQAPLREKFKLYLDSRIATYKKFSDKAAANAEIANSIRLQSEIWKDATVASKESPSTSAGTLMTISLNEMLDIFTTRAMSNQMHPPPIIFAMLFTFAFLCCTMIAGFSTSDKPRRGWLHIMIFSGVLAFSVYVIMDIEYPRLGIFRVDSFDVVLVDLRRSWDQ